MTQVTTVTERTHLDAFMALVWKFKLKELKMVSEVMCVWARVTGHTDPNINKYGRTPTLNAFMP